MTQPVLDRPATTPEVKRPGPPNADGNPTTNARGQIRGPGPVHEPEVQEALKRRIAKDLADITRRTAIEEEDAEISSGTAAGIDEVPIAGWIVLGAEAGIAGYQAYQIYKDYQDIKKAEEEQKAEGGGGGNRRNVQVQGYDPCDLQPYNKTKCPDKYEAHHVIADMVLRYGKRGTDTRIPNAPSLNEGLTICLSESEHDDVHAIMDRAVKMLGKGSSTGDGTAPISQIVDEGIKAIEKVKPECKGKFEDVRKQFEHLGDQPGRTTHNPPKAGSPAESTLRSGGAGTAHD